MALWNVHFLNSLISAGRLIYRFDSSTILKIAIREKPVEREMVEKKIKKKEKIKGIFLRRIKTKVRSRIKNNLVDLVERRSSTLIISLPDFAKRASAINI